MIQRLLFGCILTLSSLIAAFWLAWLLLIPFNYGYSQAYDILAIDEHITRFAPENQFKTHFEQTDKTQHQSLFKEIVNAVNRGGQGLTTIYYELPDGTRHTLLTDSEATHLQDVANLITGFAYTSWVAVVVFLLSFAAMVKWHLKPPNIKQIAIGAIVICGLAGTVLLLLGPTFVFYWLHIKIFPENHQWFFYYQESLMTTMMKAPDLFGFIAALWFIVALIVFIGFQWLIRRASNTHVAGTLRRKLI